MTALSRNIAIVAIGRNEGERLARCLRAALAAAPLVVYVDSGSADGSVAQARAAGCSVVELDPAQPFTAARARNQGFAQVMAQAPQAEFVQFIDGDCELDPDWLERAAAELAARSGVALVRGHLREVNPRASVYNRMCDLEWEQTPGEIRACGGIFLIRAEVFRACGGFRSDVIAAEDDEFCVRVRRLGCKLLMLDLPMARHDAAMMSFAQWWRRARRAGHAYAQVAALHGAGEERYFAPERRRIYVWGLALPVAALALAPITKGLSMVALLAAYAAQLAHIARGCRRRGWTPDDAFLYACFAVLSRFPGLQGLLQYHWRQFAGRPPAIIEHKRSS
jgi:GT2 family glycosyltransferase